MATYKNQILDFYLISMGISQYPSMRIWCFSLSTLIPGLMPDGYLLWLLIPVQHWKEKRKQAGLSTGVWVFWFASQWGCWIWWFDFFFFFNYLKWINSQCVIAILQTWCMLDASYFDGLFHIKNYYYYYYYYYFILF